MQKYLKTYIAFLKANFSLLLIFRGALINDLLVTLAWAFFNIISIYFITNNSRTVYGWNQYEILILSTSFNIAMGIFHSLFSNNFVRVADIIYMGELDGYLLKPIDTQFHITLQKIRYTALARVVVNLPLMYYFLGKLHLMPTPMDVVGYFLLLLCGITILYAIWFMAVTLLIWSPTLSNILDFLYSFNGITRYPPQMIQGMKNVFGYILLPLTFVLVVPSKFVLRTMNVFDLAGLLLFAVGLLVLSRLFWLFALRHYTSASS